LFLVGISELVLGRKPPKPATQIGPLNQSIRSPSFSPDGQHLVFLSDPVGGPHCQCSRIMRIKTNSQTKTFSEAEILVDIVQNVEINDSSAFPGLYTYSGLIRYCWSSSGVLFFNTVDSRNQRLCSFDLTHSCFKYYPDEFNCQLLGVFDNLVFLKRSSTTIPSSIQVVALNLSNDLEQPFGPTVNKPTLVCQSEVLLVSPSSGPPLKFTAILDMPTNVAKTTGEKFPLIVFPHGGPHSSFSQDYSIFVAGFLELGFAVLKVNYRGSTGQGQASIEVLPGNVGTYDVMDVKVSLDLALANFPVLDANRVVVFGGSHGGFLAAHLVGQFPSVFKAAVCRNPVINLTNMFGLTDIPDWTMVEGITNGMKSYHSGVLPSPDQFKEMFSRSPIYHVDKVKTPTMILVGMKDLRVPPSQGIQLYKALKARGVETDLKVFPEDCHPLSKVETEAEVFVLTINWFLKHLGITL